MFTLVLLWLTSLKEMCHYRGLNNANKTVGVSHLLRRTRSRLFFHKQKHVCMAGIGVRFSLWLSHLEKIMVSPLYGNAIRPTRKVTFGSRPQSLPQSSYPEHTNQHAVFHSQLMGLSQIIAKGIRLGNWKGKATNNNKCYLFSTGTLIAPICQI